MCSTSAGGGRSPVKDRVSFYFENYIYYDIYKKRFNGIRPPMNFILYLVEHVISR